MSPASRNCRTASLLRTATTAVRIALASADGRPVSSAAAGRIIGDVREDGLAALIEELWFGGPRAEPSGRDLGSAWGGAFQE